MGTTVVYIPYKGAYVYAEAGFGKGSNRLDSIRHDNTTLQGAQATANRIDVDGQLNIISQQDHVDQNMQQTQVGGRVQASLGTAWQASGNLSASKAKGSSDSVNQQSGLFAGDSGYHVQADQVNLMGDAITSIVTKILKEFCHLIFLYLIKK